MKKMTLALLATSLFATSALAQAADDLAAINLRA